MQLMMRGFCWWWVYEGDCGWMIIIQFVFSWCKLSLRLKFCKEINTTFNRLFHAGRHCYILQHQATNHLHQHRLQSICCDQQLPDTNSSKLNYDESYNVVPSTGQLLCMLIMCYLYCSLVYTITTPCNLICSTATFAVYLCGSKLQWYLL